jgi:hypothetical protein
MLKNLTEATKRVWQSEQVKGAWSDISELAKTKGQEIIKEYWSQVESIVVEGLLGLALKKVSKKGITMVIEKVHAVLPLPVRAVVSKDTLVNYCFTRMESLQAKMDELNKSRPQEMVKPEPPTPVKKSAVVVIE